MHRWILIFLAIPAIVFAQVEKPRVGGGGADADSAKGIPFQDTTGNLLDDYMMRYNLANNQWEYEAVPGAGGGSIDIVWFHNDADDDSISSEGSEIHLKYGVGIDAPIFGDTGTVFVDETEFNAMYNNGDTTSGLYDFETAVFNKVAIGPDTVATSSELLVQSANPVIQVRSETAGGDAAINLFSGDTVGSADQTNSIIRFGAYNAVPTQWAITRRWSNAGLDDFEITMGNISMFELWADSAFFLKPLYLGVVTPESLAATVDYAKDAAGDSARVVTLDEINDPGADQTFSMGAYGLKFNFANPSSNGMELNFGGIFSGEGFHVHQHTGLVGVTNLVSFEAEDTDVMPLRVIHAGRDTNAVFTGGLSQFDSLDVNGELRVDANFVMGAAEISETEMEILDGATLTTTELNFVDGVTSDIQTQLNGKQATVTDGDALTFTGATLDFDGGASPSGDIGNTWADLVIQPDAIESTMVGADQINELHINFGTGTDQVSIIDIPASSWQVFYSDGSGVINELTLGASGEVLKSNGATSAPSWQADATGGSPALEDIFAWMSRDYFDSTTALVNDSIFVVFSDSSDISIFDTDDLTEGVSNLYNQTHTGDVTGAIALTIGTDKVNDTHIDWGTGANQVSIIDVPASNWQVFYSDGSGVINELTLGASGEVLKSNGATSAPSWQADATGGSPALEDIFAWMSRDYFDSTTALVNDSIFVVFSDSSDISIFDTDDLTEGATNLYNQTHTGDVTGAIALTIGTDKVNETHIDWGTGANQVSIIDVPASNWQVFYSDGSGIINELTLGASGEVLKSNGATSAPTWQTDAIGGSPTLEDIFAWMSRDYFDSTTALVNDSIFVAFADSSDISIFDTDDLTEGATNLYNQTHTGDVTGAIALTIGTDKVNDTHIDWGTGANQVSIIDVPAENWKSFYSNGSGVIVELSLGADNTFLQSNGVSAAPTFETVDSTHINDGDLSIDDINWHYEYIYLKIVHGWARAVEDSSYLTMPVHNGSSSYLLLDYATDITPTHSDTFFVSGEIPFDCSIDTLAYIMQEAGSGGVNDIDFYGPDITNGVNMTDSIYYTNATARTPGATWTIYTENITDIAASAGDRFALRFIVDFAADNDSTLIGWVRLAIRR